MSYTNGNVERNNGTFKSVFNGISREKTDAIVSNLFPGASMVTNLINGCSTSNSLQLAKRYSWSILGILATKVPTKRINAAHIEIVAVRAVHKVIQS